MRGRGKTAGSDARLGPRRRVHVHGPGCGNDPATLRPRAAVKVKFLFVSCAIHSAHLLVFLYFVDHWLSPVVIKRANVSDCQSSLSEDNVHPSPSRSFECWIFPLTFKPFVKVYSNHVCCIYLSSSFCAFSTVVLR